MVGAGIGAIAAPFVSEAARKPGARRLKPEEAKREAIAGAIAGAALVAVVQGAATGEHTPDPAPTEADKRLHWQQRMDAEREERENQSRERHD